MNAQRARLVSAGFACVLLLPHAAAAQTFITAWGGSGSGDGQLSSPVGVAVGGSENVYVTDENNRRVEVFASDGTYLRQWFMPGNGLNIAVDTNDNVYVADWIGQVIYRFTSGGTLVTQWSVSSSPALAVDASGNVYVNTAPGVQEFSPSGSLIRQWSVDVVGSEHPTWADGLAVDASGNVYVADRANQRVLKFDNVGAFITKWGSPGVGDGQFGEDSPVRIAIAPDGNVYLVDYANSRVQKFTSGGAFITKWGTYGHGTVPGQFDQPIGISVDAEGDIYVADKGNDRIQKFGFGPTPVGSMTWGALKSRYRGERGAQP